MTKYIYNVPIFDIIVQSYKDVADLLLCPTLEWEIEILHFEKVRDV